MRIQVKRKHIDEGEVSNAYACAVALAIDDAVGVPCAYVSPATSNVSGFVYRNPRSVARFIRAFDVCTTKAARKKLKPFSFTLKGLK